ncbi:MAG TPA: methionyl-tRNA formyltransferase, partial [Burkholderiales bacterium]|nr:methionyl-tRNA formyltransferase [Burkholderiales bacterium]
IRAFNPHPGASTLFDGVIIKLWRARASAQGAATPGEIIEVAEDHIAVACGDGALEIYEIQRAGGKRLSTPAFLAGFPLARGARFGA